VTAVEEWVEQKEPALQVPDLADHLARFVLGLEVGSDLGYDPSWPDR
jgi:hypothetical protein